MSATATERRSSCWFFSSSCSSVASMRSTCEKTPRWCHGRYSVGACDQKSFLKASEAVGRRELNRESKMIECESGERGRFVRMIWRFVARSSVVVGAGAVTGRDVVGGSERSMLFNSASTQRGPFARETTGWGGKLASALNCSRIRSPRRFYEQVGESEFWL